MSDKPKIRLQKLLANAGVGSRRYCEELIRLGRVSIGGVCVTEMGTLVYPDADIEVDGRPVRLLDNNAIEARHTYILLNKPPGIISSANDQFGRKTVVDLVKDAAANRIYPVGRLDYDTSGLILLTDDGSFAYRATHPKFGVEKVYEAVCDRPLNARAIENLQNGVILANGFRTSPARVYCDKDDPHKFVIVLREGKNRQVRRMAEAVGCSVLALTRTAIGGVELGGLASGEWRALSRGEADLIFQPYNHITQGDGSPPT